MLTKNNEILVRFEEVQKSHDGETLVVKNLNLDIAKGEFVTDRPALAKRPAS
jgi:putative spermidine/putrescine transport system ATP-binding protein